MSTYELDDDLVRQLLGNPDRLPRALANALTEQVPPPVPTKLGAIVRVAGGNVWVNADPGALQPWVHSEGPTELVHWTTSAGIGRITEVLFEGVDL